MTQSKRNEVIDILEAMDGMDYAVIADAICNALGSSE